MNEQVNHRIDLKWNGDSSLRNAKFYCKGSGMRWGYCENSLTDTVSGGQWRERECHEWKYSLPVAWFYVYSFIMKYFQFN